MRIQLPDVNVLIAAAWPNHIHHRRIRTWFDAKASEGWATCPLTQCGFVRVSSNPRATGHTVAPNEAIELLRRLTQRGNHEFWPDDVDLTVAELPTAGGLVGHQQVTDAYLLGLALQRDGMLVTLDRAIPDLLPVRSPLRSCVEVVSLD